MILAARTHSSLVVSVSVSDPVHFTLMHPDAVNRFKFGRILALCLGSLAVMAPWPLLGIMLTRPYFDEASEAFMLFGGITMFPLMILALFGSVSEEVLIVLMMLVWLAAAVVPGFWLRRRLMSWRAIGVLLGTQSAFSLAQALMGALLILGKNV